MKVLYQFTKRNLVQNKHRTIVTIIGVVLISILMFGIGLGFSTLRESMIIDEYRNVGKHHVLYTNVPYQSYKTIIKDKNVDIAEYSKSIDFAYFSNGKYEFSIQIFDRNSYELNYFNLLSGNYPKNGNEIIVSNYLSKKLQKDVNDKISLNEKEYIIVGIIEASSSMYPEISDCVFTNTQQLEDNDEVDIFVTFKNTSQIYDKIIDLSNKINLKTDFDGGQYGHEQETIHEGLLELNGQIRRYGKFAIMILCLMLLLTVLGFASILVIYNSFAISVTERKKQLGILSSIGATRWQLLKSVMIEATIIAFISIPLGFLLSIGFIKILLSFINYMMVDVNSYSYTLNIYWIFLLVPTIFILISVYLSALFPAMRAFEITPLSAIRQNDDIKLNKRSLKGGKLVEKIFGIEGKMAYKNSKRNKRKYRITILSLVVSIVLFITFSTFLNYGFLFSRLPMEYEDIDVSMSITGESNQIHSFYDKLTKNSKIEKYYYYQSLYGYFDSEEKPIYEYDYTIKNDDDKNTMLLMIFRDNDYNGYLDKIGKKEEKPIVINYSEWTIYDTSDDTFGKPITQKHSQIYQNINDLNFDISIMQFNGFDGIELKKIFNITDFYVTNLLPDEDIGYSSSIILVLSESMYHDYLKDTKIDDTYLIGLKTKDFRKIERNYKKIENEYKDLEIEYENSSLFIYQNNQEILLYKILLYIFILFILIIAITNIFNTIYTNINLRKKEFATLRSMGMTPKGFHKMMFYESLLFGLKSLFYGIFISLFILWIISMIWKVIPVYGDEVMKIPFPTNYIIITIVGIMILVLIIMFYSIIKLKKDNIIDVIKENSF